MEGRVMNFKTSRSWAFLETMKLEIPVQAEAEGSVVDIVLVKPNDVAEAGRPLFIVRVTEC